MKISTLLQYLLVYILYKAAVGYCTILLTPALGISLDQLATQGHNFYLSFNMRLFGSLILLAYGYFRNKYNCFKELSNSSLVLLLIGSVIGNLITFLSIFEECKYVLPLITKANLFNYSLFAQLTLMSLALQIIHPFVTIRTIQILKERFTQPPKLLFHTHKPDKTITE